LHGEVAFISLLIEGAKLKGQNYFTKKRVKLRKKVYLEFKKEGGGG
jgi:hypothetical protein